MVVVADRNTNPAAMISAYKIAHTVEIIQPGGVRGDWFNDLYHLVFALFMEDIIILE
jgi:hypothetical protein